MGDTFEGVLGRFALAGTEFERTLRSVLPEQWTWSTPCTEWDVRLLVNHMTRGNLSYTTLLAGGTAAEFVRLRDAGSLGDDPVGAYSGSLRECAEAFAAPGALEQILDYPLGKVTGAQALAVRTTDSVIHTWDLARAIGADEELNPGLVGWIDENLGEIYAGLPETPAAAETTHRFFAEPPTSTPTSQQDRLLQRMGRSGSR